MTAKLLIPARGFHAAAMRANMRSRRRPGEEWLNLALGVWAILAPLVDQPWLIKVLRSRVSNADLFETLG